MPWKPVWPVAKLVLMVLELPLVRPFTPPPRPYEAYTTVETKSQRELVEHLAPGGKCTLRFRRQHCQGGKQESE